jgi:membrane-associated phospholipid phosphatase
MVHSVSVLKKEWSDMAFTKSGVGSLLAVLLIGSVGLAAPETPRHIPLIPPVWKDLGYLVSQRDFYYTLGGIGLAPRAFRGPFQREDPEITEEWGGSHSASRFFGAGSSMGSAIFPIAASASLIAIGRLGHATGVQQFGSDLFRVQAVTGLFTGIMKVAINRTRPNGGPYSYPSGHTSTAFATAAVIESHFGPRWGIPAFLAASYVGLSRLQQDKHYISDVAAGAILGSYIGFRLSGWHRQESMLSVSPTYGPSGAGLGLSLKF